MVITIITTYIAVAISAYMAGYALAILERKFGPWLGATLSASLGTALMLLYTIVLRLSIEIFANCC